MNYAPQIIETFKASAVDRILVIDDAYDPPEFDARFGGALLEVLSAEDLRERVSRDVICDEAVNGAIGALNENELDDSAVRAATAALFGVFVETRDGTIDPAGHFDAAKGSALEALDPLLELLQRCGDDSSIVKVGLREAEDSAKRLEPDVIFMDFYLSPTERTTRDLSDSQWAGDRNRSIRLLKSILAALGENVPAVVLMTSEDVRTERMRT